MRGTQGQRDALFALLRAGRAGEVSEAEAIPRLSRSPHGVGVAMEPVATRRRALDVGRRPLAMAQRVVQQVGQVWAPRCLPLFRPAGFQAYTTAWLTHDGQGGQGPRRQAPGPAPPPRWLALPARLSAPVGNTVRQRRGVGVQPRGVFGTIEAVTQGRRPRGWQLQTALVERRHLSLRHPVAAMGRRGTTLCKGAAGWRQPLGLFQG